MPTLTPPPATFLTDAGGLWAEQAVGSVLLYGLDWSGQLAAGDSIAASEWVVDTGLAAEQPQISGASTTALLSGGLAGRWYRVSNSITTASGQTLVRGFRVFVTGGTSTLASVFPDLGAEVAALRRDRLAAAARTYAPDIAFTDEYLVGKLVSAEREVERALRVFLTPREIVPDGTPQDEIDALTQAGERVVIEPGYDFDPAAFNGTWGALNLRQRPIIAVRSVTFHYPMNLNAIYEVDLNWLRMDKKYGRVQFVPFGAFMAGQLGGFVANMIGLGAQMPLMIRIRYRAGLENVASDWPDILSAVKQKAVLGIIDDLMLPKSASTSGDGLSQSIAFQASQYHETLENKLDCLRQALFGLRLTVC